MWRRLWRRSLNWRQQAVRSSAVQCRQWKLPKALSEIKKQIHIPLVADIHFDYRLAIAAMENGADKIRINPGNIGSREQDPGSRRCGKGDGIFRSVSVSTAVLLRKNWWRNTMELLQRDW